MGFVLGSGIKAPLGPVEVLAGTITMTSLASSSERTSTPLDIVLNIARYLDDDAAHATLSSLSLCCKAGYTLVAPVLYSQVVVNGARSEGLFDLAQLDDTDDDIPAHIARSQADHTFFHPRSAARRLWLLRFVQRLIIRQFPSEASSKRFQTSTKLLARSSTTSTTSTTCTSSTSTSTSNQLLLPLLSILTLQPASLDAIRTFSPETYDKPHSPAFLEALVIASRPGFIRCQFRVSPSNQYNQHCAASTNGAYNFVSRLSQLRADGWDSLKVLQVEGAVQQVLPSLPGVENRYHFASHVRSPVPALSSVPVVHSAPSTGQGARIDNRGLPGPQWTYRAWQCMTAVKNVIKAAKAEPAGLSGTSWSFRNISGHVMTVAKTDPEYDEEIATEEEVDGLVRDCVEHSLERDLQFEPGKAEDVRSRIAWI